jgi:enamine deaminase RidA (YjgF/YER057c/UK114 family)
VASAESLDPARPYKEASMMRKHSQAGIGFSVVELQDVRHVFAAAIPRRGATLEEQAFDALRTIAEVIEEEGPRGSIVQQSVFLSDIGQLETCRHIMREFYGADLPATTYIPQHPCCGKLLSIEALGVGQRRGEVEIERHDDRLVVTRHNNIAWVHCGHVVPDNGAVGVHQRSLSAFQEMCRRLGSVGIRFNQVIRTWLYLGDIVGPEGPSQRYKELNRARTDFFHNIRFAPARIPAGMNSAIYPASTGIGADDRDVVMSCIAFATDRDDILAVALENPRQTSAYDYAAEYSPKSPKFSRAMALSCGSYATIFISGTASITDSESRYPDDAEAQTHQTLDNIAALISESNLAVHGIPGLGATLEDLAGIRVYIKRQEDYLKVREVCQSRLGELPAIYAVADVCRPELLVEIEGIAFSSRRG